MNAIVTPRASAASHIPGLDLIRAIAVSMVLICHWSGHFGYWFDWHLPGELDLIGDAGVELFFALSGFLIGRILLDIVRTRPEWRDLRVFLTRRALRTLPLYFVWLAVLLVLFPPRRDAIWVAARFATLTQNLAAPMPPDYYYAVTWSLAIEEWFYLLFGSALIGLARWIGGTRAVVTCLAVFMLAPLVARLAGLPPGALVPNRIDEIAYGVLMAWLYVRGGVVFHWPLTALAVGLVSIAVSVSGEAPLFAVRNLGVIGCALCLPAALSLRRLPGWCAVPVRWLASRSYAIYLVHLTILYDVVEVRLWEPGILPATASVVLAVALPFVVAELSYRWLETPMLRLRPGHTPGTTGGQAPRPVPGWRSAAHAFRAGTAT